MLPSQAEELKKIANENKLMYGVAFQNRLNPAITALERAIKDNRFGKIITATIRLRWCRFQDYYEDGWHGTWAMDGGVINQQAIHHIDALNWLFGPIKSVNSIIGNIFKDTNLLKEDLEKLKMSRIELEKRMIKVLGKGNKERYVIIGKEALKSLDEYLKIRN